MYYGNDGKFYLEPEPEEVEGYVAYFKELGNTDAALCLDPESGPFLVFSTTSKYGREEGAMLDAMIALIEAVNTLTDLEKLNNQLFYFVKGFVYKTPNGNTDEPADYFPMEKSAPAKVELCMN